MQIFLGGERGLGILPLIEYPFYDVKTRTQKFPFRTFIMIIALFTQLFTSFLTRTLLGKGYFPECCDVLSIYSPGKSKDPSGVVQSSSGAALMDSSSVMFANISCEYFCEINKNAYLIFCTFESQSIYSALLFPVSLII
jgi:hypothetical protein